MLFGIQSSFSQKKYLSLVWLYFEENWKWSLTTIYDFDKNWTKHQTHEHILKTLAFLYLWISGILFVIVPLNVEDLSEIFTFNFKFPKLVS